MFNRLRALFLRYASHHQARWRGVGLPRIGLRRVGQVERVFLDDTGLRLVGWSLVEKLRFSWSGGVLDVQPDLPRNDVVRQRSGRVRTPGFNVTLPLDARDLRVEVATETGRWRSAAVSHPCEPRSSRAVWRARRAFARDLIRACPAAFAYARHRGEAERQALKSAFGLNHAPFAPALDAAWIKAPGPSTANPAVRPAMPFTIVMPVHHGFDTVVEALARVAKHTNGDWHAIVIDDASTDTRVRPFLVDWVAAQDDRAELIALDTNLGFVGAVNLGFAKAETGEGPVVLLNSDAYVPPGWADRLLAPLNDPSIASVTPFSNNAEIFSVPLAGQAAELDGQTADLIDATARGLRAPNTLPSAPTGVGYCMALSRDWLSRVPRFDTAFGRGYGEEVDWCQRVRALGGRHVGAPNMFVFHAGGASFGAEKTARVAAANARLRTRYPSYDAEVQEYLARDPLRTPRLALGVAWAGLTAKDALPLYLAHSLGGGADLALEDEIARDLRHCGAAVVLRVGGASRYVIELRLPQGKVLGATASPDVIKALFAPVPRLRIVYSCGVGDPCPAEIPNMLLSLRRDVMADRLEARLHDYFVMSPSYCLLGSDGRYRGPTQTYTGRPNQRAMPDPDLADWRARWNLFLSACDEITAYSKASADLFAAVYPMLTNRIALRPPAKTPLPGPVAVPPDANTIGVLGNLNQQKGASVLVDLAAHLTAQGDTRDIVVIGNVDAGYAMPSRVRIHGGYDRSDIAALARRYRIATWVVPAIWPETYSFATREALATGLPVIAFDLGGQGEAVSAAPNGIAVPYDPDADLAARLHAFLPDIAMLCLPANSPAGGVAKVAAQ